MDTASPEPLSPTKRKRRTKLTKTERYSAQILQGINSGQSQRQVAARLGISHSSISEWLDTLDQEKQQLSRYRSNRTDALSQIQSKALTLQSKILDGLLEGLPPDASLSQKSGLMQALNVIAGTAYDKERLETGQSSANISVMSKLIGSAVSSVYDPSAKLRKPAPELAVNEIVRNTEAVDSVKDLGKS